MASHLYTLADQLEVFDVNFDLKNEKLEKKDDPVDLPIETEDPISTRWTIGWVTPGAIITCYLMAVSLATAHLGLCRWLNERRVDQTLDQPYVTALALIFVNGFRMFLAASLGISFIQIVWKILRHKPMRLSDLDRLLSILGNPLQLGCVYLLSRTPIPFLCALVFWCLPIAMIFPPGALTVESRMFTTVTEQFVPVVEPGFIGNNTYQGMLANALWASDNLGNYGSPSNKASRVARQAILAGNYITSPSPCGQNCSYSIDISGPSFQCNETVSPDLASRVNGTYPQYGAFEYVYLASQNSRALTYPYWEFVFELQWSSSSGAAAAAKNYQNLSCTAYEALYSFDIIYLNGEQTITTTNVRQIAKLNASHFYDDYGLRPVDDDGGNEVLINSSSVSLEGGDITDINRRMNIAAIQDTLVDALSGYIDRLILHARQPANTIIELSELYSEGPATAPVFNISASTMQNLLQNITISMLSLNQTTTLTNVTQSTGVNVYSFSDQTRLIVPYFLALFISALFIIAGGFALVSNGISASTGGLFQTLCTTRGSERLGELAAKGCLGGRENVPEDLKDLKVMFGVLKNRSRMTGLGTEEEIEPLIKGGF